MTYLSVAEAAKLWGISERSVRNYCAQGRVQGAFLSGKTWTIPADAQKPERTNRRPVPESALLARLRTEASSRVSGGIYHKVQVELTYNSNHIEGSKLTHDQTRLIFETSTIGADGEGIRVDDIVETVNHFRCIDYVIKHATDSLSEAFIKELHRMLKTSTHDSGLDWFAVGDYKLFANEAGGRDTTAPENVAREMAALIQTYEETPTHSFEDIVAFHVAFERIHPFQDGNGRVGRLIMFKECLRNRVTPFVITDEMKLFYYRGLRNWGSEHGWLMDTCRAAQDTFKAWLDYYRIDYDD